MHAQTLRHFYTLVECNPLTLLLQISFGVVVKLVLTPVVHQLAKFPLTHRVAVAELCVSHINFNEYEYA